MCVRETAFRCPHFGRYRLKFVSSAAISVPNDNLYRVNKSLKWGRLRAIAASSKNRLPPSLYERSDQIFLLIIARLFLLGRLGRETSRFLLIAATERLKTQR